MNRVEPDIFFGLRSRLLWLTLPWLMLVGAAVLWWLVRLTGRAGRED